MPIGHRFNCYLITESFFKKHFESKGEGALKECGWLTLKAVNGSVNALFGLHATKC